MEDFLSERKQQVTVNSVFWKWHNAISDIPQRSVLGHMLFVPYMCYSSHVLFVIRSIHVKLKRLSSYRFENRIISVARPTAE